MLEWLSLAVTVVKNTIAVNANETAMARRFLNEHRLLDEGAAVIIPVKCVLDKDFIETLNNVQSLDKHVRNLVGKSIRGAITMAPVSDSYFTLYFVAKSHYQFMAMINGLDDEELAIEAHIAYKRTILLTNYTVD